MKDLIGGKKKFIPADKMKYCFAPQYETLKVEAIFALLDTNWPDLYLYFPDKRDIYKLPRQFILNTVYTMKGLLFHKWVQEKIAERNEMIEKKADLMICMDPQIAAAFNKSTMISTSHGSGS